VNPAHTQRQTRKIRRTGRHTTPSQVQKVAEKAGKAAPAMAIAGVLVAAPQAHAAVKTPARAAAVVEQVRTDAAVRTDAVVRHDQVTSRYTVRQGDTLSSISRRFYGNAADWPRIWDANKSVVPNPNVIRTGMVLTIPSGAIASTTAHTPKHRKPTTMLTSSTSLSGTLSCGALEELWEQGGGSHAEAFMAAEIAMAESSGEQFATGAAGERGYWQINPDHGSLSTYDPLGNAEAAVAISADGTNWTPWTTFTSGAYRGRC
jgi:LysM repeat protein